MSNLHKHNILFEASEIETRNIMLEPYKFPYLQHLVSSITFFLEAIDLWSLNHTAPECNSVAEAIAQSVITGHRYQSYVAAKGPAWLSHITAGEAGV
ncbi:hypothetical protein Bca52824_030310 [Brassica carinata]|uniref:RNase H type-1 domain-containing protein n=1 Tax=Brassica carinata TaxID=52824 RepID=A0A8X7SCY6_BRACI|nr:hypothetical protein Bca52824_030310 [Brassica carinata]